MKGTSSWLAVALFLLIVPSSCTVHSYGGAYPPPRHVYVSHYPPPQRTVYVRHYAPPPRRTVYVHNHYHASSQRVNHRVSAEPFYHHQQRRVEQPRYAARPERRYEARPERRNHGRHEARPHHDRQSGHEARRPAQPWYRPKADNRSKKDKRDKALPKRDSHRR